MISDALVFALFVYALAFVLALLTAGIIKVIHMATSVGDSSKNSSTRPEGK